MILRGPPVYVRSDNGPEFIALALREWMAAIGAKTAYIEPGSPWENGYCESFNSKLRDELLNGEVFVSLVEAEVLIEAGGVTTTPSDRPAPSATDRRRPRPSSRAATASRRGRARLPSRLRARPPQPWRQKSPSTNIETGSPLGGRPIAQERS